MLNEREDTITSLQEQLSLVQKFDFDNKEFDLDNKEELLRYDINSLARDEQAGLKAELDALAKEETSLNNLLFSITDALSTVQVRTWNHLSFVRNFLWDHPSHFSDECSTSTQPFSS